MPTPPRRDPRAYVSFEVTSTDYAVLARAARYADLDLEEWARQELLAIADRRILEREHDDARRRRC